MIGWYVVVAYERIYISSQVFVQNLLLTFVVVVQMGKLKKRIRPSDITINIGKDALIPECPIPGQRWLSLQQSNLGKGTKLYLFKMFSL